MLSDVVGRCFTAWMRTNLINCRLLGASLALGRGAWRATLPNRVLRYDSHGLRQIFGTIALQNFTQLIKAFDKRCGTLESRLELAHNFIGVLAKCAHRLDNSDQADNGGL